MRRLGITNNAASWNNGEGRIKERDKEINLFSWPFVLVWPSHSITDI